MALNNLLGFQQFATQEAAPDEIEGMPGYGMGPNGSIFKYGPGGSMGPVTFDPVAQQQAQAQQATSLVNNAGMGSFFDLTGQGYPTPPAPTAPALLGATPANTPSPTMGVSAPPPPAQAAAGSYDDQLISWLNGGQVGAAPTFTGSTAVTNHIGTNAAPGQVSLGNGGVSTGGTGFNTGSMAGNTFGPNGTITTPVNTTTGSPLGSGIYPGFGGGQPVVPAAQAGGAVAGGGTVGAAVPSTRYPTVGGGTATTGTATGAPTTTTAPTTGATQGKPTYAQLLQQYRNTHGGANPPDPDSFNSWAGTVAPSGWTDSDPGTPNTNATIPNTPGPNYGGQGRDMGAELGAINQFIQPIAQTGFNTASQFNPQYTNLAVQNYNTALQGVAGGMNQAFQAANPGLTGYTNTLGQFLDATTANTPGAAATAQATAALSSPTAAPQTNLAQVGGPAMQTVQGTNVNPNTGFNAVQAQQGNAGLAAATGQLGSTGPGSIQQLLEQQAMQGLQQGRGLSAEDKRMAEQAAREGWGARGLINSTGAVAEEVLNRDAISRQRERERQSFASAVDQTGFGQRTQGFNNALGLSQANLGYANLGLQGQQANLAAQLQGNQLGFQGQVANQGNALQAGLANQGMGFNFAQLATGVNQGNAAAQNNMGQFGANLGQQNNQFNATAGNQLNQFNAQQANNMNQFNQNLALQGNQNVFNNAMQYGNFQAGQAINPFQVAGQLSTGAPDYTNQLLGYGQDLFNTNYNAVQAAKINAANVSAGKAAGWLNFAGDVVGAIGAAKGCWVAREVFGEENPKWVQFRHWMLNVGPKWFRKLYLKHGEAFAGWLKRNPWAKPPIRAFMENRIASLNTEELSHAL